jgi:ComF family protein
MKQSSILFRSFGNAVLDALFPQNVACALCNREALIGADGICDDCRGMLKRCPPLKAEEPLDGLAAAFVYDGSAIGGIHNLKYENRRYVARFFADMLEIPQGWSPECIVPVPLHPKKHWKRGFNQSELIAGFLSARCGIPVNTGMLIRTKNTRSQARLDAADRHVNVVGAFLANSSAKGCSVLLIDDVTTTHSTLNACAAALKQSGASRVYALCVCAAGFGTKS